MDAVPLNGHIYTSLAPDQVTHRLTDDGWSSFDFGPMRVQLPVKDLSRVKAARALAQAIAAQAGFWDGDLAAIEAGLVEAEQAKLAEHTSATGPQPAASADDTQVLPDSGAPFGGEDPKLDARVHKVATLPETRRRTGPKPAANTSKDET